jgi:hypothetical protein
MTPEELHKMAPRLSKIGKKEVFSVPPLYFEQLPAKLEQLILSKKQGVFTVPENYFENLPHQLQQLVLNEKQKETFDVPERYFEQLPHLIQAKAAAGRNVHGWDAFFQPAVKWGLALVVACVCAFVVMNSFYFSSTDTKVQTAQLTKAELKQAVEAGEFASMDEEVLMEQIEEEVPSTADDKQAEITNYLIENNVELNTLINEL